MRFSAFVLTCLTQLALPCNAYLGAESEEESDERRVWIKYKDGERDAALRSMSSFMARSMAPVKVHHDFSRIGAFVVTATVDEINELSVDPMIDEIVEDVKRYPMHLPESMHPRELQTDGETVPYGITMVQAADAHAVGYTGQGARVCVVDTGIDRDHEDFVTSRLSGLAGGPDLDWTKDAVGHGTHCSGTIAAARNGVGVVGVAPDAEVYTVRVFDGNGGFAYGSSILSAVQECADAGFNIVSMSLGGPLPNIFEWFSYRNLLEDDGILCIAAAGNSGNRMQSYPASYPGVISVAAIDDNMELADFSQRNRNVDLAAPGVDVLSTFPTNGCQICDRLGVKKYGVISGTSMATPHVAGVAALLRAEFPDVSAEEIADAMLNSAMDLGSSGRDTSFGNGLVQALDALELLGGGPLPVNPNPNPSPPTGAPPSTGDSCPIGFTKVEVNLLTDDFGEQSYWWIVREEDSFPVALGTRFESNKQYDYSDCLASECYKFTLYDANDDGLTGEGRYLLTVDDRPIDSAIFTGSVSHTFGTCSSVQSLTKPICVHVSAVVRTDEYPQENSVRLFNERDGSTIWSSTFDEKQTLYDDMTACLDPEGCYKFEVEDEYGDGLCVNNVCDGFVTLTFDGEVVVSEDDANFGSSLSVSIGKCSP